MNSNNTCGLYVNMPTRAYAATCDLKDETNTRSDDDANDEKDDIMVDDVAPTNCAENDVWIKPRARAMARHPIAILMKSKK
jgi:hypothetical protein